MPEPALDFLDTNVFLRFLTGDEPEQGRRALDLYVDNPSIDFVDCLNVAHMEQAGIAVLWTFDKDYQRIKGIAGIQPREP